MAATLFGSLVVVALLALAPQGRAGDPFGAAPSGPRVTTNRPTPGAPIAEIAPYLSTHSSSSVGVFRSGPSSLEDYRYLRTSPASPEIALYRLVVRPPLDPPRDALLPRDWSSVTADTTPQLDALHCSSDWFASNACVLRLYTGEGRR